MTDLELVRALLERRGIAFQVQQSTWKQSEGETELIAQPTDDGSECPIFCFDAAGALLRMETSP